MAVPADPKENHVVDDLPPVSTPITRTPSEKVTVELNGPLVKASDEIVIGKKVAGREMELAVATDEVPSLQVIVPVALFSDGGNA